ncbi:hypothetical protein F5878DRAFT_667530 [Lentinula raphanica]|uniref:Uncharacterized protein n=1 Tax=Lentinula raphanica TaxID=153919 RepID=A0AA38NVL7_9AGAR|nr:hypothetical protein F5878DRAFT_667530 [Lentinula raphanica]
MVTSHSSAVSHRVRVVELDDKARRLAEDAVSRKTRQRRFNDVVKFLDWAHLQHLSIADILPASENTLCNYAASFAVLPKHLRILHDNLSAESGLDVCVAAAAKVMMYGQLRSGEVLPTNSDVRRYDSTKMPLASHLSPLNSSGSRCLFLPSTKTSQNRGDEVLIPVQNGRSDPIQALQDHLAINNVGGLDPLFLWP